MRILSIEGCNIFENLSSDEYNEALNLLTNNILATDIACHIGSIKKQEEMLRNEYDKNNPKQQKLLFEMLMICCDLNDQTKDWKISKETAVHISSFNLQIS